MEARNQNFLVMAEVEHTTLLYVVLPVLLLDHATWARVRFLGPL